MKIARQFHWEMGHRLPFHEGLCRNIHGHSYRLWVELDGTCDAHGMLIDYGDLKKIIQPIIEPIDHCFICDESDAEVKAFLHTQNFKMVVVPFSTTAENIAAYLLEKIWLAFEHHERVHSITLRLAETETTWAEVGKHR